VTNVPTPRTGQSMDSEWKKVGAYQDARAWRKGPTIGPMTEPITEDRTMNATANCCSFESHMSATRVYQYDIHQPRELNDAHTHAERDGSPCRRDTSQEAADDDRPKVWC
jgi:hypothetical protein